jgi:CHAT domain-containing protein/Tfp pilus assembly protein PilF
MRNLRQGGSVLALAVLWAAAAARGATEDGKEKEPSPAERATLSTEVVGLNAKAVELLLAGKDKEATRLLEKALTLTERLYPEDRFPDGHPFLAQILNNLAALLQAQGEYARALSCCERALAMRQKLYPEDRFKDGHPLLAESLCGLGVLLLYQGEYAKAQPYYERALAMRQKLYPEGRFPDGHPLLAQSLNDLGVLLRAQGEYARALPYLERALAMRQKLYSEGRFPDGHPELAASLNSLGVLLGEQEEYAKALPYFERALAMRQKLYPEDRFPDGHHQLAQSLNNLAALLRDQGEYAKALPYFKRALAMRQKLYPEDRFKDGHPDLAWGVYSLGTLLMYQGEYAKALPYFERALAMRQKLYPEDRFKDGHPLLAESLCGLGLLLLFQEEYARALPCFERALAMDQKLTGRWVANASEAEALAFVLKPLRPPARDGYLSTALRASAPGPTVYAQVWNTKAALTRLLQRRHLGLRAASLTSAEARDRWQQLLDARRRLVRLLTDPGPDLAARDREIEALTDRKEKLERALAKDLPELPRQDELDRLGPDDLAKLLPAHSAFVDLLRYCRIETFDRGGYHYLAFVLVPKGKAQCVDLGPAKEIDDALRDWRAAIDQRQDSPAAARLRKLVWEPIAEKLPADAETVFLSPDGDLARLPWAALPGRNPDTVLLQDHALAVVPHGPFLLEQLRYPFRPQKGRDGLLALGGLHADLPATAAEVRQAAALAGKLPVVALDRDSAVPSRVLAELRAARFAHLATHGFFADKLLAEERRRIKKQLDAYQFRKESATPRIGLGVRNPLTYTGLLVAQARGADRIDAAAGLGVGWSAALTPALASPDRDGVVHGEALVELPLEGLELAVLSACETGLGKLTEGEGTTGLQRAFHLAGCPNVVASLWKVNDKATAALMAVFYHQLWVEKQSPLQALRTAQLTVYLHPERIDDLADRSAPKFKEALKLRAEATPPKDPKEKPKRSPAKLWAGFVLSGVGARAAG